MTLLAYSHTLIPGTPEDITDVQDMFEDVRTWANGNIDSANLANNAVTTVEITDLAVTTAKIANNGVTAAKIEAQPAWTSGALTGGATGNLRYYKDSLGHVWVAPDEGVLGSGAGWAGGATLFNFPSGSRPGVTAGFFIAVGGAMYRCVVNTSGNLIGPTAQGAGLAMSNMGILHWRAEN